MNSAILRCPQKFLPARHKTAAAVPLAREKPSETRRSWMHRCRLSLSWPHLLRAEYSLSRRSAPVASRPRCVPSSTVPEYALVLEPGPYRIGSPAAVPEKSIAVLPFDNLSEEKANAFFTDGVQDEILTDLAKVADLKVISRSSVMQYKSGVARDLAKLDKSSGWRTCWRAACNAWLIASGSTRS